MSELFTENWNFIQTNTWPSVLFFGIFLVSVAFLAFQKKRELKELFCYSLIVLVTFIYNPYFWQVLNKVRPTGDLESLRMLWLVPAYLVMAYLLTRIVFVWKKKWQQAIALVLAVVLLWQAGTPYPSIFREPQNRHKISEEGLEISNIILDDMKADGSYSREKKPTVLAVITDDNITDDTTPANYFYNGMRQYSSAFVLSPVELYQDTYQAEGFSLGGYFLDPPAYLVCRKNTPFMDNIESLGYHSIGEAGDYQAMRYHRTITVYVARHARSLANVQDLLQGNGGDAHLTARGREQAAALGKKLADVDFSAAYTSQLSRTKETAEGILAENHYWNPERPAASNYLFNDISWGQAEGMKREDAIATFGAEALDLGAIDDASYQSPIGAETKYSAVGRFRWAMQGVVNSAGKDGTNALVVAHSSIVWWIQYATGVEMELDNADYVKLSFTDGVWSVAE